MLILQRLLTLIHINLGGVPDKLCAFSLLKRAKEHNNVNGKKFEKAPQGLLACLPHQLMYTYFAIAIAYRGSNSQHVTHACV